MTNQQTNNHITQAQQLLEILLDGKSLSVEQARTMMHWYMEDALPKELGAALLIALRMKGESVDELVGCVQTMQSCMNKVVLDDIDSVVELVGTGGDGQRLFNISSVSCFVAATSGARIAKHFNRSNSSKSGGADFLASAGANIQVPPHAIASLLSECNIAFMFAPLFHPAMRNLVAVRQMLATRTIFNLLGPLANPASIQRAVVGVFDTAWQMPMAHALQALGYKRAWVVHSMGTDELMVQETNHVVALDDGEISRQTLNATDFGLKEKPLEQLQVADAAHSVALATSIMQGDEDAPGFNTVVLNAAAALYVGGISCTLEEAICLARDALINKKTDALLRQYVNYSHTLTQQETV